MTDVTDGPTNPCPTCGAQMRKIKVRGTQDVVLGCPKHSNPNETQNVPPGD